MGHFVCAGSFYLRGMSLKRIVAAAVGAADGLADGARDGCAAGGALAGGLLRGLDPEDLFGAPDRAIEGVAHLCQFSHPVFALVEAGLTAL